MLRTLSPRRARRAAAARAPHPARRAARPGRDRGRRRRRPAAGRPDRSAARARRATSSRPPGTGRVPLGQSRAHDFDPRRGDGRSIPSGRRRRGRDRARPGRPRPTRAAPSRPASRASGCTSTPRRAWPAGDGRSARRRSAGRARSTSPSPAHPPTLDGWQRVADFTITKKSQKIPLDTAGQPFRYYLIWITKLPPGAEKAEISEVLLYK